MVATKNPARRGNKAVPLEAEGSRSRFASRARRRARLGLAALLLVLPAGSNLAQVPPPHLDILTVEVRESPSLDPFDVGSRTLTVELTLAGTPVCDGSSTFMAYGVLIDSDLDPNTGIAHAAFDPLGVDARISAECDPAASQFVSEAGAVVLGPPGAGGEVQLTITTNVFSLPAVEFHWIGFAMEDASFTRLPAAPDATRWAIVERRRP